MKNYRIFIAYDKTNYEFCSNLEMQLQAHPWTKLLPNKPEIWYDIYQKTGEWDPEIRHRIVNCNAIVLLLSARYLGLPYVIAHEWPAIKRRLAVGNCRFFPVLMDNAPYKMYKEIAKVQIIPRDDDLVMPNEVRYKPGPKPVSAFFEEQKKKLPGLIAGKIFDDIKKTLIDRYWLLPGGRTPIDWDEHFNPSLPGDEGLVGRSREQRMLKQSIENDAVSVVALIGDGGMGKSTLIGAWLDESRRSGQLTNTNLFAYTFTPPIPGGGSTSVQFFSGALSKFGVSSDPDSDTTEADEDVDGNRKPSSGKESEIERVQQLINLVKSYSDEMAQKTWFILDGIDVLRQQIGQSGKEFDDPAMRAFISIIGKKGLPHGCKVILTCRFPITELEFRMASPSHSHESQRAFDYIPIALYGLSNESSRELLYLKGVSRTFLPRQMDSYIGNNYHYFGGNPLALGLYAGYVKSAHHGNPEHAGFAAFTIAPNYTDYTIKSSANWLSRNHKAALWILRAMGLVHRPLGASEYDCLHSATQQDSKEQSLNDFLPKRNSPEFKTAIYLLEEMQLIEDRRVIWNCHALKRDWFAEDFEEHEPELWRIGHSALFDYFKPSGWPLAKGEKRDMEPLYRAVVHGCLADRLEDAFEIYWLWIHRGEQAYSTNTLGNHTRDLSALAGFFQRSEAILQPGGKAIKLVNWGLPRKDLADSTSERVIGVAAFCLHSVGLIQDAIDARRAQRMVLAKHISLAQSYHADSLIAAGRLVEAKEAAERACDQAREFSGLLWAEEVEALSRIGAANHLMGYINTATSNFSDASKILGLHKTQKWLNEGSPTVDEPRPARNAGPPPGLYSLPGSRYWELQITKAKEPDELLEVKSQVQSVVNWLDRGGHEIDAMGEPIDWLLDRPLAALALGRIAIRLGEKEKAESQLKDAVSGIRLSGQIDQLPSALLTRAHLRRSMSETSEARPTALEDAEEVRDIAQRFGLVLYEIDACILLCQLYTETAMLDRADDALREAKQGFQELTNNSYGRAEIRLFLAEARLRLEGYKLSKVRTGLPQRTLEETKEFLNVACELIKQRGQWIDLEECQSLQNRTNAIS